MPPDTGAVDQHGPSDEEETEIVDDGSQTLICWVCQQPLDKDVNTRVRGEPAHHRCWVELRCGISVGDRDD